MRNISILLLLAFVILGCSKGKEFEQKEIVIRDLGTVIKVSNCNGGKYSYNCRVETTKVVWSRIDITDFPYEGVEVGDSLMYETVNQWGESNTRLCRNGMCNYHSSCSSWQSCWKDIPTNAKP